MLAYINYIIPLLVLIILLWGFLKNVDCFSSFLTGAKEGMQTVVDILPSLMGLMVAIGVFRASGALDIFVGLLKPITDIFNLDPQIIPLALLRPISGSASLAILSDVLKTSGADSLAGRTASVIMGSSETILYTMTIYLGASGIKKAPKVLLAALLAHFIAVIISNYLCIAFFS